jgi:hypothetical protein
MSNVILVSNVKTDTQRQVRDELVARVDRLTLPEMEVLLAFAREIVTCHDPDVVGDFLEWRNDPRLGSILQLAAAISDDMREQLLFVAEDFYSSEHSAGKG